MSPLTSSNMAALLDRTPKPNYINPFTMSTTIIIVTVTSSAVAFCFLCTKLYAALKITRSVKLDDCITIVAFLFTLANVGLLLNTRKDARHAWDLPNAEFPKFLVKMIFTGTMLGALGLSFAKLSILFLFLRLFSGMPTPTDRNFCWNSLDDSHLHDFSCDHPGLVCTPISRVFFQPEGDQTLHRI